MVWAYSEKVPLLPAELPPRSASAPPPRVFRAGAKWTFALLGHLLLRCSRPSWRQSKPKQRPHYSPCRSLSPLQASDLNQGHGRHSRCRSRQREPARCPREAGADTSGLPCLAEAREAGPVAAEAHPVLPAGSAAAGWPSRPAEKQADMGQELPRQLLANGSLTGPRLAASFLARAVTRAVVAEGAPSPGPLSCQAGRRACCLAVGERQLGTPLSLC